MNKILILDYGNDLTPQLCTTIEELGFTPELASRKTKAASIAADSSIKGVILSGAAYTIFVDDIHVVDPELFTMDIPVLGLGRGMQVMIHQLGGTVTPAGYEYAPTASTLTLHNTESGLFKGLPAEAIKPLGFDAKVSALPEGFSVLASGHEIESGDNRPFGAIENPAAQLYGIQYVVNTHSSKFDTQAINNFLALCA
ncbi:MAG TPA: hypothetical protein VK099_00760 [Alcanivoracaceae bacterium]|nr:hypothetical protein [Alcanivoracaceae bacterium]